MKTNSFENKICWITGASSGIGAALAISLNAMGASVILSGRNKEKLEEVNAGCAHPENNHLLSFDMENIEAIAGITREAWNIHHRIDFVFLNAGMAVRDMIRNTEMEMVLKLMTINFFSNVAISKTLIPLMQEQGSGRFIVTSSISGKLGVPKLSAYAASKHALHGFFESLRAEYDCDGIKVTMIVAGAVRTNITLNALKGNGSSYGRMQKSIGEGISPEACANTIIRAVDQEKSECLVGGIDKYIVFFKRFLPFAVRIAMTKHPLQKLRSLGLMRRPKMKLNVL